MLISTLDQLPEEKNVETVTAIFSEYTAGINVFKDVTGGVKALLGKRTDNYEKDIIKARQTVLDDLVKQAEKHGANAILSLTFQYDQLTDSNITLITVYGSATAVRILK
ncbi:hypothetical protein CT113_13885 [Levilactobacillus brevis]|uniref:YbjQ family protein n=1 Tax=Levilactobacillus brevis TaxID=1580 RepID=UPI000428EA5B|nr:heavy metal-binding domain-containing protein [Levilactobacillus brevis]ATU71339.1 hypothetical protein CT113_13885 [Levilactobacillus brevis]